MLLGSGGTAPKLATLKQGASTTATACGARLALGAEGEEQKREQEQKQKQKHAPSCSPGPRSAPGGKPYPETPHTPDAAFGLIRATPWQADRSR